MASLHKTIDATRFILKIVAGFIISLILLFLLFRVGKNIYDRIFPPPPPKPDLTFGQLPQVIFPENTTPQRFTYTVNTISGQLPAFPYLVKIYTIKQPQPNILALSSTEDVISHTEFAGQPPQQLSDTLYTWTLPNSPFKRITIDTVNLDFTLTSQYVADENVLEARNVPDEAGGISVAKSFFQSLSSYPADIDDTKTKATLLSISNGVLIPATSISTTQIVRVDFYQKERDTIPVYYPHFPNSTINALVSSGAEGPQVIEAHYAGKEVEDTNATYPIITANEAFAKLQSGDAYIVHYTGDSSNPSVAKTINITDVTLGYYLGDQKRQLYLMPIAVFQGDGFLAYVSLVKDMYIDHANPNSGG